jgi:hypothetical protein
MGDLKSPELRDGIESQVLLPFDFEPAGFVEIDDTGMECVVHVDEEARKVVFISSQFGLLPRHDEGERFDP